MPRRLTIALAGTPNVGKSAIFHQIAGAEVIISNYPGTTVELIEAKVGYGDLEIALVDLPGVYSLGAISEDELVARRAILEQRPDVVVNVLDASNLERGLYLTLQLLELGFPMLVILNMYDVASSKGLRPDPEKLSRKLGVPVIPTVATRGENIAKAFEEAVRIAREKTKTKKVLRTGRDMEEKIKKLGELLKRELEELPYGLPARTIAVRLLEGDRHLITSIAKIPGSERVLQRARAYASSIGKSHGEPAAYRVARERHSLAAVIAREVTELTPAKPSLSDKLNDLMMASRTGIPLMVLVFAGLLLFLILIGGWLESVLTSAWEGYVAPSLSRLFLALGGAGKVLNIGLNWGISGILAVMIPYIFTFFLLLGLLEDVGYLPRAAFVMDSAMHRIGLHGRAVIPMLGGFGCSVPAIIATRALASRRERLISSFLITMIPCSARTAVILGTVGYFLGLKYALAIYAVILSLIFVLGLMLNRWLPGQTAGMIMEVPPLRRPMLRPVLTKTWIRMKHFLLIAVPLLLAGSFLIGAMQVSGILDSLVTPLSPITAGWLGLPPIVMITLAYGFIRKEGALVLLVALAGTSNLLEFMTPLQLFVYALVVATYLPCAATAAILRRELGLRLAFLTAVGTFVLALLLGGLFFRLNPLGL